MDENDPGALLSLYLTIEQLAAAAELVSANLESPEEFSPIWRAIVGPHTGALARSYETLELTVLVFRGAWYNSVEKTLGPERLNHLTGFVGKDHLDYIRTRVRGECTEGGVSAIRTMPEGVTLERLLSEKLHDLGDEVWNQFWTGRVKLGRELFLSYQVSQDRGFAIISAPRMPTEKTDAIGNVRVGKWRYVTDHSYPGSPVGGGQVGAANTQTTKFHHPRPHRPTPEQVTRMSLECSAKHPGVGRRGFRHDTNAAYNIIDVRARGTRLSGVLLSDSTDNSVCQVVQTTCDFGFEGAFGIYSANVAVGTDAFHAPHKPKSTHINGPYPFRSTTYGGDTMVIVEI